MTKFRKRYTGTKSPFSKAGILSKSFFSWMNPMFNISARAIF